MITTETPLNNYPVHNVANTLNSYDTTTLKASIKEHGLFQPVLLWYSKKDKTWYLADGKHRVKACNELGIKVDVKKLPKSTKEEDLPIIILETQLIKRGLDLIVANCEAVEYLTHNKDTAVRLFTKYNILHKKAMERLKTIKSIRPDWFNILRNGGSIDLEDGTNPTKGLARLAGICKNKINESNQQQAQDMDREEDKKKDVELGKLFKKYNLQVEHDNVDCKKENIAYVLEQVAAKIRESLKDDPEGTISLTTSEPIQEKDQ